MLNGLGSALAGLLAVATILIGSRHLLDPGRPGLANRVTVV